MLWKKMLGSEGENLLDDWFTLQNFTPILKNKHFRGGEIDRIYANRKSYCFAEVKTIGINSIASLPLLLSEVKIKSLVKEKQINNLLKAAQFFPPIKLKYIRIFLICVFNQKNNTGFIPTSKQLLPTKLCYSNPGYCILSLTPEFTTDSKRHNMVQVRSTY